MKSKVLLSGVILLFSFPVSTLAQNGGITITLGSAPAPERVQYNNLELVGTNYVLSFAQQSLGKILRGENVLRSLGQASYEALPSTAFQYVGMKLVGSNWRMALPARVLTQKGAQIQRRSMLGLSVFSPTVFTSWELDYLWFNFRVDDRKVLTPRANVVSFVYSVLYFFSPDPSPYRFMLKESLLTGTIIQTGKYSRHEGLLGAQYTNNILLSDQSVISNPKVIGHEFVHIQQEIRASAIVDVLARQDFSQYHVLPFLRAESGFLFSYLVPCTIQSIFGARCYREWEADHYSKARSAR